MLGAEGGVRPETELTDNEKHTRSPTLKCNQMNSSLFFVLKTKDQRWVSGCVRLKWWVQVTEPFWMNLYVQGSSRSQCVVWESGQGLSLKELFIYLSFVYLFLYFILHHVSEFISLISWTNLDYWMWSHFNYLQPFVLVLKQDLTVWLWMLPCPPECWNGSALIPCPATSSCDSYDTSSGWSLVALEACSKRENQPVCL